MSGKNDIVAGIRLDGEKEFKQNVTSINKSLQALKSEMNKVSAEYSGQENSIEALSKKQEILNKILEEQKRKASETKVGLEHAKASYNNVGKGLEKLRADTEKAQGKLSQLNTVYGESSKEAKEQAEEVERLRRAIEKGETNYKKAGDRVKDWETKLNNAESQVVRANENVKKNTEYMKEAEKATDKCAKSIDKFGKEIKEVETNTFGDSLKANILASGIERGFDLIKREAEAIKDNMMDVSKASTQLAASTGISETSAKRYQKVMKQIKGDNFGENYEDIADAMTEVIQTMGELDNTEMTNITESAIALRDTFGMDINENIRAADVMIKTMGVDAQTAFDLIAKGAQNGLNRSGELTDNLIEYGSLWGQAGFSAEEAFGIMENGLNAGAYNLDKVNDYVKEFGISLSDGRIEDNLKSFSEETQRLFGEWKDGKASTKDVFYSVISDLEKMENQQQALTIASETWSSLGEDNAMQVLTALNDVNNGYENVKGTMDELKQVSHSDLGSAVSGLGASIQENIVTPMANMALPTITNLFTSATDVVNGIGEAIKPQKTELELFAEEIKQSNEEAKAVIQNAEDTMQGAEEDAAKLDGYKNALIELNQETQKTEFEKFQIKSIVNELSGTIPELAAAWDEETGSIKLTNEELTKLIDNQKNVVMQSAILKAQKDTLEAVAQATIDKAKAESALSEAQENLTKIEKSYQEEIAKTGTDMNDLYADYLDAQVKVEDYGKQVEDCNETLKAAEEQAKAEEKALSDLKEQYGLTEEQLEETGETADGTTRTIDKLNSAIGETGKAAKKAAKNILDAYEENRSEIESDLQNKISLFDMFETSDGGEDFTVEKMTENLNSQIEAFRNYEKNLEAVKEHVGKEISPEFMQYIQDMGMEGANTLEHILQTFADEEPEKVKELNDKWLEAMDQSEAIARAGAANKTAYEMATGELGSSDMDFSELSDSIDAAVSSASESWSGLSDATKAELDQVIQTAKDCGVKIPEGLTEGIASGEVSPEEAIAQLEGSIQGTFEGLAQIAKEQGITIPEELSAGIENGGQAASDALNSLIALISEQAAAAETAGKEVGSGTASGAQASIEEGTPGVEQASADMAAAGATAADGKTSEYSEAGKKSASEYIRAIREEETNALTEGANLARAALRGVSGATGFYGVGVNISASVAAGIADGSSRAIAAARNMAASALAAAKAELEIHSPSKKFRKQVGQNISESTAFGIKDKAALAGKAAASMSAKVYSRATSWLSKYKKRQKVSLADEKWYWQQVQKHTKKGTEAYTKAMQKVKQIGLQQSGLSSSLAYQVSKNFGVSRTETTGSGKNKKTTKKSNEDYYGDIYSAAEKYLSNYQILHNMSLQQEKVYWEGVKKNLKSGTQAWYDATEKINGLKEEIKEAEAEKAEAAKEKLETQANVQQDMLDKYKTYYKVSAKAEMDYWNMARNQFKKGTDERIAADQKYFEAQQAWYDERKELDQDYADSQKEINEKLISDVKELEDAYKDAVKSRKDDILSQMDLFDAWDASGYDADTLLYNLKTQVSGLALWEQQLEELGKKGLAKDLMEELKAMGPEAAANIYSLNHMTAKQLAEYNRLWQQKNDLAQSQAVKDNEGLRQETNSQISDLRKDAQDQLNMLNADYQAALKELNEGMSQELINLVRQAGKVGEEAVSGLVGSIQKAANSVDTYKSTTAVVNTVSDQLKALEPAGKEIGKSALDGLLSGLTDETKINIASKSVIQSIKRAMQEEAEIHSPAKLFEREVGDDIPGGVAVGMDKGAEKSVRSAKSMVRDVLAAAQEEMNWKQAALQEKTASLNYSGIMKLNRNLESYQAPQTIVNVDNNKMIGVMENMLDKMQSMIKEVRGLQVVLDTGTLAGEMQPLLDQQNAAVAVRKRRGNL